jgi:molybdopterin-binding protein
MSHLKATIEKIESVDDLNIVTFDCAGQKLQMVSLELSEEIQLKVKVKLACKPIAVALAKPIMDVENFSSILSYSNQLKVQIDSIERGKLLSSILLRLGTFSLESIMGTDAVERLSLEEGDDVIALIKANELSILEVLND